MSAPVKINYNEEIPADATTRPGMPSEPVLSPTRPVTVRGTLTVYLIALPIVYIVFYLAGSGRFGVSWLSIVITLLMVGINYMMYVAIQPTKLAPTLMTVFAYFYITRFVLEVISVVLVLTTVAAAAGEYAVYIPAWIYVLFAAELLIDGLITFLMVRHAFTLRTYAYQVRQVLAGQVVQTQVVNQV
ncbi:UNVERIFIED_CONTAM: hypothetical protein HDU68_000926 [Siphonaria sp. JEL0065]|nr:hypothetical protein HDU68_000926 [Siphonaria sp. JEL0065]